VQLLARHYVAWMRQQKNQNLERLGCQANTNAALAYLTSLNIYFKRSEREASGELGLGCHDVSPRESIVYYYAPRDYIDWESIQIVWFR
jgi:hypothetical protein